MFQRVAEIQRQKRETVLLQVEMHRLEANPRFMDRDRNAAANILLARESAERPWALCRSQKEASPFSQAPQEGGLKSFGREMSAPSTKPPGGGPLSDPVFAEADMCTAKAVAHKQATIMIHIWVHNNQVMIIINSTHGIGVHS